MEVKDALTTRTVADNGGRHPKNQKKGEFVTLEMNDDFLVMNDLIS